MTNTSPKGKNILQSDSSSNDISSTETISSATHALEISKTKSSVDTDKTGNCQTSTIKDPNITKVGAEVSTDTYTSQKSRPKQNPEPVQGNGVSQNGLANREWKQKTCQKSEFVSKTLDSKLHFDAVESSRMLDQDSIPTHETPLMSLQHQQQLEDQALSPVENQRGV